MNYWIFQAVPERYNLVAKMNSLDNEQWFVTRYYGEIKKDDVVFFWQAGKSAGLYGWGYVESLQPYLLPDGDYRVQVSYKKRFTLSSQLTGDGQAPIPKNMIKQVNELQELQILQAPQGTNFRVKPEEAQALKTLITASGFVAPP